MDMLCISTKGITSGTQFSEALFQTVQEALYPRVPARATEWLMHLTLVSLHVPWHRPDYSKMEEGWWRMLVTYTVQDYAEHAHACLVIADLARMLNSIRDAQGKREVLAVCQALQGVQRIHPEVFLPEIFLPA